MAPDLHYPDLRIRHYEEGNPAQAARLTRTVFGLKAMERVPNIIRLVEKHGGAVFGLPIRLEGIDAFALWAHIDEDRPVIVLSSSTEGDRQRFSTAHELGHLVMHRNDARQSKVLESEADLFAAEFLLPADALRAAPVQSIQTPDP